MGKTPSHIIKYEQKGKDGAKLRWMKVGAMWPHETGFSISLDAIPTNFDGHLVAFEPDEPEDA